MEKIPGVASAVHLTWFNGIYQDESKNFFASFPTDPEPFLAMYPEFLLPEAQKQAWLKTRIGAIAGRALVDRFKWKLGDRISLKSPIWPRKGDEPWEFEIVGIYEGAKKGTDTSGFYFRYDYFDEGRARGVGLVGWYGVRVNDPDRATEVAKAIDNEFANSPYETKAEPEGAFAQGFVQQMGDIGTHPDLHSQRGVLHDPARGRQHHGAGGAQADRGTGRAQGAGFHQRTRAGPCLAESCLIAAVGGLAGLGFAAGW
jgi:putative ABC transport system permease protein